jgi:hypothetical protein
MRIVKRLIHYVIKKIGYSSIMYVPPQCEFRTKSVDVTNKTNSVLEILIRGFKERRKEAREDDTVGTNNQERL